MPVLGARTRNRRRVASAASSSANDSGSEIDASKCSADISAAVFVRGVTTSSTCDSEPPGRRRRLMAKRMDQSIGAAHFGGLARRGGGQAVLNLAGLDAQRQAHAAHNQQRL